METAVAGYYGINSLETQGGRLGIAAFGGPLGRASERAESKADGKTTPLAGVSCAHAAHCTTPKSVNLS
jgi:hypothetical protein